MPSLEMPPVIFHKQEEIYSLSGQRPNLAKFLREICKGDLGDTGTELFRPQVQKKITDRADTIEAFNKAIAKVEAPSRVNAGQKQDTTESSRFLSKRPTAVYGGRSGHSYIPYDRGSDQRARQNQFCPRNFQSKNPFRATGNQPDTRASKWRQ